MPAHRKEKEMDALKEQVAECVYALMTDQIAPMIGTSPEKTEIQRVDTLNTLVRVQQGEGRGPRYFKVQVSEML